MPDLDNRSIPNIGGDPCEREAIHAPGSIQPHAALFVFTSRDFSPLSASANSEALFPAGLPAALLADLRGAVADGSADEGIDLTLPDADLPPLGGSVHAHVQDGMLVVEVEPLLPSDIPRPEAMEVLASTLASMERASTLESLTQLAVNAIRRLTGMERVLVYRFDNQGHGTVVAESLAADWDESFKGFSFPAADIPPQARHLYLVSLQRFTPMRDYVPVPMVPALHPATGRPFDIGRCRCRSLSPVHRTYQENLGVDGAMSLSVVNEGRLWGLVVGHHRRPHRVSIPARGAAAAVTMAMSMRLSAVETAEEREARARHVELHARLLEQIAGADDFVSPLVDGEVKLTDIFFASSGAAVVYRDGEGSFEHLEVRTVGSAPDSDAVVQLSELLRGRLEGGVFATDCLGRLMPDFSCYAEHASGALAITVGENGRHMVIWFRPEIVRTTVWGGANPSAVDDAKRAGDYFPRRSFTRWVEEQCGHSRPWPKWKLEIAHSLRNALNDVILRQMRTIRTLNYRLAEADQAKSRFLSHMSHELRTPLNAVLGFAEMLAAEIPGSLNPQQASSVDAIQQAGRHLLCMINDVLDLSKVEAGRLELHEAPVDLGDVVARVVTLMRQMADEHGLGIECQVPEALPRLRLDERLVKQILFNLISNAIKFTRAPGRITITVDHRQDGGVSFAVTDTGVGIPADKLGRVLEPFRQAHDDIMHTHTGTGLGLPIVKALAELHGGWLDLDSVVGQGTMVRVNFPADRVTAEPFGE